MINIGDYVYQETFDLTGLDPSTAVIHGALASDDNSTVILNGVDTGVSVGTPSMTSGDNYDVLHPFTLSSGFVAGINTLQVTVHNDISVTGLRLQISGTANSTTPTTVTGTVSLDLNADGTRETGEPGLANRVVYLDLKPRRHPGLRRPHRRHRFQRPFHPPGPHRRRRGRRRGDLQ